MIKFRCAKCNKGYSFKEQYAGKSIRCKNCGTTQKVPLPAEEGSEFSFLDSLSEVIEESQVAGSLPPKRMHGAQKQKTNRSSSRSPFPALNSNVLQYASGALALLGLIPLFLILQNSATFFTIYMFFSAICIAATITKVEEVDRWSVPSIGLISGYTIMMLFAAAASRNPAFAIDFVILGIGLAVFINSRSILGVTIMAGIFVIQIVGLSGVIDGLEVDLLDLEIKRSHILANVSCLIYLCLGYTYHLLTHRQIESA